MKLSELTEQELNELAEQVWHQVVSDPGADEKYKQSLLEDGPEAILDMLLDEMGDDDPEFNSVEAWTEGVDIDQNPLDGLSTEDVNDDGDTDVYTADVDGDGEHDVAVVAADSPKEGKDAEKAAKDKLGVGDKDKTSTGKTKDELGEKDGTVSDKDKKNPFTREGRVEKMSKWGKTKTQRDLEKKKDGGGTVSDERQKNILSALMERIY